MAVRFAKTGGPLSKGDAIIRKGSGLGSFTPRSPTFTLPAPTDPRKLLELFSLFDEERGLPALLYRCDFNGTRRAQLEYAAFGEVTGEPRHEEMWNSDIARDYLNSLLRSARFQQDIAARTLRAFPEKRRIFFVHIPKCAGTDLLSHLTLKYPRIRERWREHAWFDLEKLFRAVSDLVREVALSDAILMSGHVPLDYYIGAALLRPSDRVFTVVRDPVDISISAVNYVITRLQSNVGASVPDVDVKDWLCALGIDAVPAEMTPQFVNDISRRALYSPQIVEPNPLCHWLGGGDAATVVARLARYHVEITTTARYTDWLASEWNVTAPTRANASTRYLSLSSLAHCDLVHVETLSPEDRKLFDLVDERLTASGRTSIFGEELL